MIDILFCGNDGVFDGVLTCALSILRRTDTDEPFCFHIFTKAYNADNCVMLHDVTRYYMKAFSGCPNESAYCSPYTLIRLFADVVRGIPDKLLYLDADIMFNRDIRLLWDTDLTGYEYAAARDHYGKYLINPGYINAGVLLFNMKLARQTGLFKKARWWIKRKKLTFADQSALIRSTTRRKLLPQRFNDQKFLHRHTVVRHFSKRLFWLPYPHTDNIKQWHIDKVHSVFGYRQFDDIYCEYEKIIKEPMREKI